MQAPKTLDRSDPIATKAALFTGSLLTIPVDDHPSKTVRFADVLNAKDPRAVLINFWATWCDPCRREFPQLAEIASEQKKLLRYVGVVTDGAIPDNKEKINTIAPRTLRRPQYGLKDISIVNQLFPAQNYGAPRDVIVPLFVMLDSDGRVLFKCEGSILDTENSVRFKQALIILGKRGNEK